MNSNLSRLAGQTAVYGISSVVARLLNYLLVPYYTRIMSTAEYGVITDIYALIPFALVVLTMGMESGYFRFAAKAENEQAKRRVFSTAWGAVMLAAALFMAVVLLFRQPLAEAMGYAASGNYIWIVGAIIALDVAGAIPFARLRQEGRAGKFVIIRLLSVIVNLALCLWFYTWPSASPRIFPTPTDPGFAFVANLVSSAVTFILLLPTCDRVAPRIDRRLFRTIFLYSLPLLVSGIAGTANEFIDRQMIKYLMPASESMAALGIYGAVVKIGVVMLLFTQMYRLAAEPFFLAEFKKDEFKNSNAEALKYFIIVSVLIFLFITLFADLFALIVGRDFREGIYILPIVLVSNMLSGVVLNLSFWYKQTGATRYAIVVTGIGLVFTVVFNILLVPSLGYLGAALARLVCELTMVVISYLLNQKYYPIPYDLKRIGEYLVLGGLFYGLSLLCAPLVTWLKYLIFIVMLCAYILFFLRREKINIGRLLRHAKSTK